MSWIYKRYIAFKLSEIIITNIFNYFEIDETKLEGATNNLNIKDLKFELKKEDSIKIIELIESCIERVKPLSKSKSKGNKRRKLNNGKELQKHDSQLSILMPHLINDLLQWYFQSLVSLNLIPDSTNIRTFKFKNDLTKWCNELKDKFPKNKYIQSVIALGIYLNFTVSKAEFLKLQLYTIPFILSNSKEFMIEQKKIIDINSKCSIPFEISNENKNIILYFTPVKLNQILSSSSTPDVGTTIESMTNHVKSLILSNFISKLYSSNDDIVNYLKFNSLNLSKDTIYNSIFMTRYTEDVNSIAKILYTNEKNDNKLQNIIKEYNNDYDKEQYIINEIYDMIIKVDEEIKENNDDNRVLNRIKEIETYLENKYEFFFDQTSEKKGDSKDEKIKAIIKNVCSLFSKRYLEGIKRFISNNQTSSLEIYNEICCHHPKNSILGDSNQIHCFENKNLIFENLLLYWIFGYMYRNHILKYEEDKEIKLDSKYENETIIEQGKQIIKLLKESTNNIYIDLESIDFSHNKTSKFIPIIKNIKQGKIYLKTNSKNINNVVNIVSNTGELSEFYSDLVLIINRVLSIYQNKPIEKFVFVNNINKEHHYMQIISILEWIQYCCEKEGKLSDIPNTIRLEVESSKKSYIEVYINTEWELITHGRIDNLWDLSVLDALDLTSNKIILDLNFLIDASKIEMSEVIESNIEKYRDMEKELLNESQENDEEFKYVRNVDEIIEISGVSSIVLQNLQFRRMKNYKYEWITTSTGNNDSFDDFDDFNNNKKSNVGLYLQYIYAKICSILRNCDFKTKQKEFSSFNKEENEDNEEYLFSLDQDIFKNIENISQKQKQNQFKNIFDFDELVRVTPEVFPLMWFLDDYIYNIYPSVYQKIEPSLILDALNQISHSISSVSSNLRVKGLGKSKLSNEIKALNSRKRLRENEQNDTSNDTIETNDQYWLTLANTRLLLFSYVRKLLYHGLSILGVQPLDRM
ncbi:hypothetical protein H8356DRAFT_1292159 [Neocallimastix lanati (nom. inval.)]|uniref:DALR anticodon binding domain-containing protein n=1 Tax=Neocallimastix californiae TaxID=1754190 RepID=A0A1Y2CTA6_9FUNG|nr:hypothetical protein H8356DRAFT_1292159 [Neocallimastix sp. JGI-2020a]ORY50126.1 hypothetical protein LY90DRAFT_702936 [Neocallimastix californiae]|eukprot:ORY50126.1 hypothetical protein LY90DRAFT_702936 [Neocallimastix californiae]